MLSRADVAILAPAPPVPLLNDGAYPGALSRPRPPGRRGGPSRLRSPGVVTGQPGQVEDHPATIVVEREPHGSQRVAEHVALDGRCDRTLAPTSALRA
jgi:hypothetical protein